MPTYHRWHVFQEHDSWHTTVYVIDFTKVIIACDRYNCCLIQAISVGSIFHYLAGVLLAIVTVCFRFAMVQRDNALH